MSQGPMAALTVVSEPIAGQVNRGERTSKKPECADRQSIQENSSNRSSRTKQRCRNMLADHEADLEQENPVR